MFSLKPLRHWTRLRYGLAGQKTQVGPRGRSHTVCLGARIYMVRKGEEF
jgi:hypothetical protein